MLCNTYEFKQVYLFFFSLAHQVILKAAHVYSMGMCQHEHALSSKLMNLKRMKESMRISTTTSQQRLVLAKP